MVPTPMRPRAAINLLHFIKNPIIYQRKIKEGVRYLGSSPPERTDALNYLKSWVGNSNSTRPASSSHSSSLLSSSQTIAEEGATTNAPLNPRPRSTGLTVSGASYLLPTLCLERSETPTTLSTRLQYFFGSSGVATSAAIRAMLRPKFFTDGSTGTKEGKQDSLAAAVTTHLKVPIILDMKAFQHDGSPHYKPPSEGSLKKIVAVLSDWGIVVLGLTNVSRTQHNSAAMTGLGGSNIGGGGDSSATRLEEEAIGLGLPVLMARAGRTLGGSANGMNGFGNKSAGESLQLEDVVRLLITQAESSNHGTAGSIISDYEDSTADASNDLPLISPLVTETDILKEGTLIDNAVSTNGIMEDGVEKLADSMMSSLGSPIPGTLPSGTKIFHGSVRSGVIISTDKPNQSLVIIGNVNSGGEVMAEGNLFVFGRLRGRALAGLAASKKSNSNLDDESRSIAASASIFASNFDPELICIGESFTTVDSVKELGLKRADTGAMVSVDNNGKLVFVEF